MRHATLGLGSCGAAAPVDAPTLGPPPPPPRSQPRAAAGRRRPPLRRRPRPRDRRPGAWRRVEHRPTLPGQRHWGCKHHGQNASESSEERLVRVTGSGSGIWAARGGDWARPPSPHARGWGRLRSGGGTHTNARHRRAKPLEERGSRPGGTKYIRSHFNCSGRGGGGYPWSRSGWPALRGGGWSGAQSDSGRGQQLSVVRGGVRHSPWRGLVVQSGSGRLRRTWLLRQAAGPRREALTRRRAGSRRRRSESQERAREACTCAGRAVYMEHCSTSLPRCPAAWGGMAAVRQAAGPRGVALRRAQAGSRRRQSESQDMAREACTCAGRVTQ